MSDHVVPNEAKIGSKLISLFKDAPLPEIELPERGPIEQKMRAILKRTKNSKYPDTFDWSVYDKIAAKFGKTPPRGGVVFNTGLKLVNHHSSCSKCHYAFEIDTYGRGCTHNCVYCYAKTILTRRGYWNEPQPFPVNLAEIRKIFFTVFETDKPSKWRNTIGQRFPLRLGSMSDCFMWMDKKYRVTYELLKLLKFYNYPYIIFTRSDLVAHEDYLEVMDPDLCSIQISMSGGNEKLTRMIEPGSPGVKRRLEALRILAECGFWTTVRINPLFPIYPDGYYTDRKSIIERFGSVDRVPKFELFDWDFISQLREAKVPSLVVGIVRLTQMAIRDLSTATGINFRSFFKPELYSQFLESKFSDSEAAYYYKQIQQECLRNQIRFQTCYIGMGTDDYYQYQKLWTNKKDCCDARGNVSKIKASSQDISWETRFAHATCLKEAKQAQAIENELDQKYQSRVRLITKQLPISRDELTT